MNKVPTQSLAFLIQRIGAACHRLRRQKSALLYGLLPTLVCIANPLLAQESVSPAVAAQQSSWQTLVDTDQRFAQRAEQAGRTAAFLEFLAQDSVVFRSGPVDAIELYSTTAFAQEASQIAWKAHYVDVSAARDLGLSAGPLTIFGDTGAGFGHLISIWRYVDASWQLMADITVNIPGFLSLDVEPNFADTLPLIEETANPRSVGVMENTVQSLIDADELYGRWAFLDTQLATTNPISLNNVGAYLSQSKEMGYTYGTMQADNGESAEGFEASYMRLWRFNRSGEWRIAVEVLSPF